MKLGLAAAVLVAMGVAIFGYFVHRGATLEAKPRVLTWVRFEPDAGEREVDATWFGTDFVRLQDVDEPIFDQGALRRGDAWALIENVNCFEHFVPVDGGVYVVGQWCTEGGGTIAELLYLSVDGGAVHLASLPKPVYFSNILGLEVEGETLRIAMETDIDEGSISVPDEWVFAPLRFEALRRFRPSPGSLVYVTSKNGGRSWRMERHAESR